MENNSTESFIDIIATESSDQLIDNILSVSNTTTAAFDNIASPMFFDTIANNSNETYPGINATNTTEVALDIVAVSSYEIFLDIISACIYIAVFIVGTAGNILVCNIVYSNKKLRTALNIQLVSLASADLIFCIIIPLVRVISMLISVLHGEFIVDGLLCAFQMFVFYSSGITTIVTLGSISVIRAIAIRNKCSNNTKKMIIIGSIVASYAIGVGYGILKVSAGHDNTCNPKPTSQKVLNITRFGISIVFTMFFTLVISYSYIYHVTAKNEKALKKTMDVGSCCVQGRRKPRNITAFRIAVIIISIFTISYISIAVHAFLVVNDVMLRNEHESNFTVSLASLGSMLNPIVYSLTSSQFKKYLPCQRKVAPLLE
ncbi:type-1 angiotensin II receptor-like [Saccoglossus kowalevskii]|uniref:Type-1 angiotensin II receptor-like n=1 Tax=Saccoglossus kowalevskii TaxID=10224 RepID=A0ABM0LWP6_SACKO|nr:PREDICTED: type-1 angiotensin II receptor-like [Saccoglossus kowalevskii]